MNKRRQKNGLSDTKPGPGNFPLRSLESRAAARAKLEGRNAPPSIVCIVVKAPRRDLLGNSLPHDEPEVWAEARGVRYERRAGETAEELQKRVLADQPVGS